MKPTPKINIIITNLTGFLDDVARNAEILKEVFFALHRANPKNLSKNAEHGLKRLGKRTHPFLFVDLYMSSILISFFVLLLCECGSIIHKYNYRTNMKSELFLYFSMT